MSKEDLKWGLTLQWLMTPSFQELVHWPEAGWKEIYDMDHTSKENLHKACQNTNIWQSEKTYEC